MSPPVSQSLVVYLIIYCLHFRIGFTKSKEPELLIVFIYFVDTSLIKNRVDVLSIVHVCQTFRRIIIKTSILYFNLCSKCTYEQGKICLVSCTGRFLHMFDPEHTKCLIIKLTNTHAESTQTISKQLCETNHKSSEIELWLHIPSPGGQVQRPL